MQLFSWQRIIPILAGSIFAALFVWYIFIFRQKPLSNPSHFLPDPVAVVNGEAINSDMVEAELKISRLNILEPLPNLAGEDLRRATEEALNQLVVRHLILQEATRQKFQLEDEVIQARIDLLFGTYGENALDKALQHAGATHQDLYWWVSEISTVEAFTVQVIMANANPENRQRVYNDWLNAQQASAEIETYLDGSVNTFTITAGHPSPMFTLKTPTGQPISLTDYQGSIVLINFWASWCPSCISELPDYQTIYQDYQQQGKNFIVLGINLQESPEQVQTFSNGLGLTFPILLDDNGDVTTKLYQMVGMPGSIIVDSQGKIFYRHIGPMSADLLREKLIELGL